MKFKEAIGKCHVRSGVYRTGDPTEVYTEDHLNKLPESLQELCQDQIGTMVPKVYWKNHQIPIEDRVPPEDQCFDDWEEYDPREQPECSAYDEFPA